jgi:hypothetical protein
MESNQYPADCVAKGCVRQRLLQLSTVLPAVQGTALEFHSSDNLQHNIFAVGAGQFNLGTYGVDVVRRRAFNKLDEDEAGGCNN